MGTFHTPPIDLYGDSDVEEQDPARDDREVGFVLPEDNGERDEQRTETSKDRLGAVLGW